MSKPWWPLGASGLMAMAISILTGSIERNVFIAMNGEGIVDLNLDEHKVALEKHSALKNRLSKGFIGLQDHGSPVSFTNIRTKE